MARLLGVVGPVVLFAFVAFVVVVATAIPSGSVAASGESDPSDRPPVTVSDFLPEDANLSDCVGLVERPGCGSEARGGWRQLAIFAALVIGLGIVVWRIVIGLRANQAAASDSASDATGRSDTPGRTG